MSEHTANLATIAAVAVGYAELAVLFALMGWTMWRNTVVRTRLGTWLVRMKAATAAFLALSALVWVRAIGILSGWWGDADWARWALRAALIASVLVVTPCAVGVVRAVKDECA